MSKKMFLQFLIFFMSGCIVLAQIKSTTHFVGDDKGWCSPPNPGFYDQWTKGRKFTVGDVIVFQYNPGLNTVAQVGTRDDYEHCSGTNIIQTYFFGKTAITLDKPGDYFFFSSVGKHCEAGQKLMISVCAA
ncbi:PREDICTED: mavicyanin-like [Lupinus angustifolius]|uniref:mavicyanin-like n=1 Tax=Lupinus angustifolius TaxID=3871 RepID=UPI00092FA076|nr:PREDICTED: mavicyanin-like [Lupinus angustifolius]